MNVYEVKFTSQAEEQLENIVHYITVDLNNSDAAENLVDEIIEETEKLSKNPEKHRCIDEEAWGKQGIRKIKVKNFYVYFWIDNDNSVVWVIGIVYGKRDQKKYLDSLN